MHERLKQDSRHFASIAGIPESALLHPIENPVLLKDMENLFQQIKNATARIKRMVEKESFEVFASRVGCLNRSGVDARLYTVQELALMAQENKPLECDLVALHSCAQIGLSDRDYALFLSMLEQAQKEGIHLMVCTGSMPFNTEVRKRLGELL